MQEIEQLMRQKEKGEGKLPVKKWAVESGIGQKDRVGFRFGWIGRDQNGEWIELNNINKKVIYIYFIKNGVY